MGGSSAQGGSCPNEVRGFPIQHIIGEIVAVLKRHSSDKTDYQLIESLEHWIKVEGSETQLLCVLRTLGDKTKFDRFPPLVAVYNRQQIRQELWAKVYAASEASGSQFRDPRMSADHALTEFDKRFNHAS